MSFDQGSYFVMPAPAMPLTSGFPDVSQIQKFYENDAVVAEFQKCFSNLGETQKWIKNRETECGAYGYTNFELDPGLDETNFLKTVQEAPDIYEDVSSQPTQQVTSKQTFADLDMTTSNISERVDQAKKSLGKALETVRYINNNETALDKDWSYHNASMLTSVGVFAHSDEFFQNVQDYEDKLKTVIGQVSDKTDKKQYEEELKVLQAVIKDFEQEYKKAENSGVQIKYQVREAIQLSSIALGNVSAVAHHRSLVERVSDEQKLAQDEERALKRLEAAQQAEKAANNNRMAQRNKAKKKA
ncbi:hypothetical protein A2291_08070 [candidate division WOR-1 bacterium RIFOXYB2_FULL_42_35]|uniref:Uncharacterized protein n=1 Tax=candidate division WOR-1 bacterium RIFOXYC2_FULL_41_25 TaxID=1802586 RepID=A0A1F4TIF2_UNCSA|nr:MAG: hypothetical protein A2247_01970 [candidate division WOR-1 bacterium RIFOXYA2_FULL_41_14]OGC24043.1 MAG: hypothetical protein A2291_08070 [candidate division WOR-1 bacterium RIFOXYB2_FULL_42_35]OGC32466.1 MAG: hypothetical protein A2462_00170 [candidate division WOR-1 bacterium RIFOXYC2_FULL_41_25]OGC44005.1 MAG: hypothetical protein A2548_00200 [candidate division WOR-1 bacterium RIFOXYD2_FULL_41_8]